MPASIKRLAALLCAALIVLSFCSCGLLNNKSSGGSDTAEIRDTLPETELARDYSFDESVYAANYQFGQLLTADARIIYNRIYTAVGQRLTEIDEVVSGYNKRDIIDAYNAFRDDYPSCLIISGFEVIFSDTLNNRTVQKISISYIDDIDGCTAELRAIEAKTDGFIAALPAYASEYEKAFAAYEYVISCAEYDNEAAEIKHNSDMYDRNARYDNINGVFIDGKAICAGYARAMQYLLGRMGIQALYVTGICDDQYGHAWNIVRIDGEYYNLDATWGDRRNGDVGQWTDYSFFCFDDATADQLYKVNDKNKLPACTVTAYNFYVRNGTFLDEYDYRTVCDAFCREAAHGAASAAFRFTTAQAAKYAYSRLFDSDDIFDMLSEAYAFNRSLNTMRIRSYMDERINTVYIFPVY